ESGPSLPPPGTPGHSSSGKRGSPLPPDNRTRAWMVVAALVVLHLTHPLTWGRSTPDLWFPPAGIGLALVAWYGSRAALLVLVDGLLVVLQASLLGQLPPEHAGIAGMARLVA